MWCMWYLAVRVQYLQMRYMLDQRDNGVRRAFKQLDTAIMGVVSHPSCPAMIGTLLPHFIIPTPTSLPRAGHRGTRIAESTL